MIAPSHYYVLLCNILKHLYVCYLDNWMIFLSLSSFLFFFTWHILSNCVLITCICYLNYLYIYYYALLSFYRGTWCCTAFFCSCTIESYWLCNSCLCFVSILSCFIFRCPLTCGICETYICVGNFV